MSIDVSLMIGSGAVGMWVGWLACRTWMRIRARVERARLTANGLLP